ncbi:MAG TPA: hypothetical protein VM103_00595 [Candidatus Paceibacterota bacterium]|nr:hypothetical protein [Candidatus Paceibacterota bacterium]
MIQYLLAFLAGGTLTLTAVAFEVNGFTLLSRVATLFPVVSWVSYLFIADSVGGEAAVSKHALFVMFGTLVAWVPYMLIIYYFAPKIGAHKAIALGMGVFFILALLFAALYKD